MNWPQIRKQLREQSNDQLIGLIKGLYGLSSANKAFVRKQFAESLQDPIFLEKCRRQIIRAIYPPRRKYPNDPKFSQARKAVNAYKKATGDVQGTIDLLLTYVERGTAFTNDYGDIDMSFYERLETALYNAADLITDNPTRVQLYQHFRPRFIKLHQDTRMIGWGYGDTVDDIVTSLEALIE